MKFLETFGQANDMVSTRTPTDESQSSSGISPDMVDLSNLSLQPSPTDTTDFEHISHPSSMTSSISSSSKKAKLLYCKSHVSIHPTQFNRDNVPGYLGIVEIDAQHGSIKADDEGGVKVLGKELLVTWVPDEMLERMDEEDRRGYKTVEGRAAGQNVEEDGFIFVSIPPPKGEKYAFSVPLSGIYSILVYPPSLSHWYGSATINLLGGVSLPTLFFHDDESPLLSSSAQSGTRQTPPPRPQWGFPPFLSLLETRAALLRSRLLTPRQNQGGELWLVNPSKSDREVHDTPVEESKSARPNSTKTPHQNNAPAPAPYPPKATMPDANVLALQNPRQTLLTGLSSITNFSRKAAQQVLSHPLAQPVVPHLPPAVRSLVNVPGEWERSGRLLPKTGPRGNEVANEFESARLYLARWARVVAEEGERARRSELASRAAMTTRRSSVDLTSDLGVFSLLSTPGSKRPRPNPTRQPNRPINSRDWESFAAQGRDELYVRREIFQRGFSSSQEVMEKRTRSEGWEVLLGTIPWQVGGVGGGESGKIRRRTVREEKRGEKRKEYVRLRERWKGDEVLVGREEWKEEWHRIDVDCRRTDRSQAIYAIQPQSSKDEKSQINEKNQWDGKGEEEEGGAARLNPHIAAIRTILMTYHTYRPELGYVQGMSDLLSPIYVVFDGEEGDAFWGLVGVMRIMESNFLRDQSGMKRQLSTLQQLIGVMDPELYAHLERTESLNLFFCFRWILIAFKREFKFEDVIRLWEVLWTNFYSNQFVLFVALAILQSHRDVLIRYLTEFDEVLKYANDLSGTIDLDSTLAQAEVLFLTFRDMVEDLDKETAQDISARIGQGDASGSGSGSGSGLRKRRGSLGGGVEVDGGNKRVLSDDLRELLDCWKEPGGVVA